MTSKQSEGAERHHSPNRGDKPQTAAPSQNNPDIANGTAHSAVASAAPGIGHNSGAAERVIRRKDSLGLGEALALIGVNARYNVRREMPEIKGHLPANHPDRDKAKKRWASMTDFSDSRLRERLKSAVKVETWKNAPSAEEGAEPERQRILKGLWYTNTDWKRTFEALLFERQDDPFEAYIDGLYTKWKASGGPKRKGRLDTYLVEMFGCDDNPLNRWAARAIFLGAIHRAKRPGCKLDQTIVLVAQAGGEGKSAFTKHILPYHQNPEWHTDAIDLGANPKTIVEALDGRVVVEFSEMQGATRAEVSTLKSFLTRTDDGAIRRAYARFTPTKLRRCIFIGTSNSEQCLPNDEAALRRFVPIRLNHGCNVEKYMAEHRADLWGEAMHAYLSMSENERGAAVNIPPQPDNALNIAQRDRAREFRTGNEVLESRVAKLLDKPKGTVPVDLSGEALDTIMEALDYDTAQRADKGKQGHVADALRGQGWTKRRASKARVQAWRWYAPRASGELPTPEDACQGAGKS